jgi:hypothetical protein
MLYQKNLASLFRSEFLSRKKVQEKKLAFVDFQMNDYKTLQQIGKTSFFCNDTDHIEK